MTEKGRIGRPRNPGSWSRIHLYVEAKTLSRLRRLGGGSQTEGLRVLFRRYDKLRLRAKGRGDHGGKEGSWATSRSTSSSSTTPGSSP